MSVSNEIQVFLKGPSEVEMQKRLCDGHFKYPSVRALERSINVKTYFSSF